MFRSRAATAALTLAFAGVSPGVIAQDATGGTAGTTGSPSVGAQVQAIGDAVEGAVKGIFGFLKNAVDAVLHPKLAELKTLVDAGKFEEAAAFWVANRAELARAEGGPALVAAVGKGLGDTLERAAQPTLAAVRSLAVVSGQARSLPAPEWPRVRADLAAADQLLQRTRSHPFYAAQPAILPAWVTDTDHALAAIRKQLRGAVVGAFAAHDHRKAPLFFDSYPVEIDPGARALLVVRASALWLDAVLASDEARARTLVGAYAPHVREPEARQMVAGVYASVIARERLWDGQLALPRVLALMQALDDAGLEPSLAAQTMAVAVLRGLSAAGDAFTWRPGDRLAATVPAHDLPVDALASWAEEVSRLRPRRLYVLVDASRVATTGGIVSVNPRPARRQIGQRQLPNPAWDSARERLEDARRELATAEAGDRANQSQAQQLAAQSRGSSFAALAAVMGSAGSSMLLASARRELAEAERNLAETPRTQVQPVLQDYRSAAAEVQLVQTRHTAIYLVDGERAQFVALGWDDGARLSEGLAFGVDPRDREHDALAARTASARERIRRFIDAPGLADASDIWRRLVANSPPSAPAPLASLPRRIREDHARWADAANRAREGARAQAQQAEERVVAIVQAQP